MIDELQRVHCHDPALMSHLNYPTTHHNHRKRGRSADNLLPHKKLRNISKTARIYLKHVSDGVPLISKSTSGHCQSFDLEPERPYTIGRLKCCDLIFSNSRVSRQHCQLLFDSVYRKIYLLDGAMSIPDTNATSITNEFRNRLLTPDSNGQLEVAEYSVIMGSLNGVFVNGVRIKKGMAAELSVGDEVLLVCGNLGICASEIQVGFVVRKIVFKEEVVLSNEINLRRPLQLFGTTTSSGHNQGRSSSGRGNKRVFALKTNDIYHDCDYLKLEYNELIKRVGFLSSKCRYIMNCDDPISCLRSFPISEVHAGLEVMGSPLLLQQESALHESLCSGQNLRIKSDCLPERKNVLCSPDDIPERKNVLCSPDDKVITNERKLQLNFVSTQNTTQSDGLVQKGISSSPGKNICLNRLPFVNSASLVSHTVCSLKELLHPVGSILRIFIATFTSDILWFLSYCEIPNHLPVTVACHNTERCWSSFSDDRTSRPFPAYPNVVVVYPQFPESIAFGRDSKRQGIACHHPKLFVLQRDKSLRVIITSANLVEKQWCKVTNTIWWQDFPCTSSPDYLSLFCQIGNGGLKKNPGSDFAAQLAGFMATLLVDVPSQAHWIGELTKYDFGEATGYLVTSVPGIHSYKSPFLSESVKFSPSSGVDYLGSVEASVVGLSHLFHSAVDSKGARLKRLAAFLGDPRGTATGMLEVVLKRNKDIAADPNALSVFICSQEVLSDHECVQLGFLPRTVAKWVSPLWDIGVFRFRGYLFPEEALAAALGENSKKVKLILNIEKGPCFPDISNLLQPEHFAALCSLIASVQRCVGLWRLEEVLGHYKWPECQETDFIYGSSSVGSSVNAQFLAAFSAASGKRSLQSYDSQESDPEWGRWSASQELQHPSIGIIFPTIERVKNTHSGILPASQILCFAESTWKRLKCAGILHDAVPSPSERLGYPMHVKVARRCFWSSNDATSFGWVYCGSHNFSAAAWGRPLSSAVDTKENGPKKVKPLLGSKLHVCNYELGIVFVVPPPDTKGTFAGNINLDDIVLPFVVPAPKYGPRDRPATKQAMKELLAELREAKSVEPTELEEIMEDYPDGEELLEPNDDAAEEKEEEKAYADVLWSHLDSSESM